jgi:3-hydroxyacyl-CoA dehydrogenase
MRLGFNWPRGPLELTQLLGAGRIVSLLNELQAEKGEAYRPAPGLTAAATG